MVRYNVKSRHSPMMLFVSPRYDSLDMMENSWVSFQQMKHEI